ncbi:hypothetical protein IFO70_39820, partial [Phormidium tenue FACHB-886]|nr:hypothetical protein [Phormidium tenue FACHB-886]
MITSYNSTPKGNAISRFKTHKRYDDLTTTALHSDELLGDVKFDPAEYLQVTENFLSVVAAKTDVDDANLTPSVNSLHSDVKQSNGAVEPLTSLPIGMAQELMLDLLSTDNSAFSGKSYSSTALLIANRPIASKSIRTASPLIFSPDQRVPVTQPSYPFNAVGQTFARWKGADGVLNTRDDIVAFSSGALVSKSHFLTAGHCIYNKNYGGWAARVEVQLPGG